MTTHAILSRTDITPMQRLILLALRDCADDAGRVQMTLGSIAAHVRTETTTVHRALTALERAGALCIERRGEKSRPQILRILDAAQAA